MPKVFRNFRKQYLQSGENTGQDIGYGKAGKGAVLEIYKEVWRG